MGIGVIGALSGAAESTPAGAGAKVATVFCGNTTKYNGTLASGNYVVKSDFDGGIFDGDVQIAELSKGALTKFNVPSNSSNITVENFFPEFEGMSHYQGNDTVGWGSLGFDPTDSYTSTNGTDGIYWSEATVYYTKDGGKTFKRFTATTTGIANLEPLCGAITPDSSYWYLGNYNNSGNRFAYSTDRGTTWTAWDLAGQTDSSYRNIGYIATDKDGGFTAVLARDTSTNQHLVIEGTGTTIDRWWYATANSSFNYVSNYNYFALKNTPNSNSYNLLRYTGTSYQFDYRNWLRGQFSQGQSVNPEGTDYYNWSGSSATMVQYRNDHFLFGAFYRPSGDIPYGVLKVQFAYPTTTGYGNSYIYTYSDWSTNTYTNSSFIFTAFTTAHSLAVLGRMSIYTRDQSGDNLLAWAGARLVAQDKANPLEKQIQSYDGLAPKVKAFFGATYGSQNKGGHMLPNGQYMIRQGSLWGRTALQSATIYQEA